MLAVCAANMFLVRIALVPLLIGLAGVASASIFGADDRLVVSHAKGSPFAPIGVAYNPTTDRYGTGFLVDECHVLTAEHVAREGQGDSDGARFDFLVGQRSDLQFERRTGATVVTSGGFSRKDWNRDADWLLLRLDQCLGREFGHLKLYSGGPAPKRATFQSAGYPSDRVRLKGQLVVDPHCTLVGQAVRLWLHTCAGRAGNSGGPVYHYDPRAKDGAIEVYAIQAAAFGSHVSKEPERRHFDPDQPFTGLNEAVPITNILPAISKYLHAP